MTVEWSYRGPKGPVAKAVFTLAFVGAGFATFIFFTALPVLRWHAAASWTQVPCQIVSSQVGKYTRKETVRDSTTRRSTERRVTKTSYSLDITYRYDWGGRTYHSDRYDFLKSSSSDPAASRRIAARYPAGSQAFCYVDPNSPDQAVLYREFKNSYLTGLFGLLFVAVGVSVAVFR